MHRLLYKSRSTFAGDAAAFEDILEDLVRRSRIANARVNVTGVLIHMDGVFVQLLEGPLDAVEAVFERICRDRRHADLQLIELVGAGERVFGDWSMAKLSSADPQRLPLDAALLDGLADRVISDPQDAVKQLMRLAATMRRAEERPGRVA